MDWLYFYRNSKINSNNPGSIFQLYLRPYQYDEENNLLVGEKIVQLDIVCLEKALEKAPDNEIINNIYYNKIGNSDYYLNNTKISDQQKELYLGKITLYLKNYEITTAEMWDWVKKIFIINNFPSIDSTKESDFDAFADTNPIMQMFSLKNVQKFEGKFGKNWWNKDDKLD